MIRKYSMGMELDEEYGKWCSIEDVESLIEENKKLKEREELLVKYASCLEEQMGGG